MGGGNVNQYVDLVNVASGAGVSFSYTSANSSNTSGTLTVSSGATVVADITFVGHYTSGNFQTTSGPAAPSRSSIRKFITAVTTHHLGPHREHRALRQLYRQFAAERMADC